MTVEDPHALRNGYARLSPRVIYLDADRHRHARRRQADRVGQFIVGVIWVGIAIFALSMLLAFSVGMFLLVRALAELLRRLIPTLGGLL